MRKKESEKRREILTVGADKNESELEQERARQGLENKRRVVEMNA